MSALASSLRFLLGSFLDFVYPPLCCGCDAEIEAGLVCDACRLLLHTSELAVCPACGRPCLLPAAGCGLCSRPFALRRVRALGCYTAPFHNLVQALKYDGKTRLAMPLGSALRALVEQDPDYRTADLVVAVPLHSARLRERGYNQSELLAAVVALRTGISFEQPLERVRNTPTQTGRPDAKARYQNLAGAFRLKPEAVVTGRSVILVDDVCISGATLDAAARPLLQAGAKAVLGLVVAAAAPKASQ